jgi:hypothetical protein
MNTFEEMTDMLQAYFEREKSAQAAICLYHQRFPNWAVPYHKNLNSERQICAFMVRSNSQNNNIQFPDTKT